ncbi:hypothetical protein E4U19_008185 [Claviceps sp. Clav32 group G5]|nr:hypothetical protein E4U19_008185 [Claviceps sp. Clav32 group G5]
MAYCAVHLLPFYDGPNEEWRATRIGVALSVHRIHPPHMQIVYRRKLLRDHHAEYLNPVWKQSFLFLYQTTQPNYSHLNILLF